MFACFLVLFEAQCLSHSLIQYRNLEKPESRTSRHVRLVRFYSNCISLCLYDHKCIFSSGTLSTEAGWETGKLSEHSPSFLTQGFLGKELLHAKVSGSFGKYHAEVLLRLPSSQAILNFPTLRSLPQFLALPSMETRK